MIPCFSAGTLFTGFVAKKMHDADISTFIGLPVSVILYWLLTHNLDVQAEAELAAEQSAQLEAGAAL